MTEETSLSPRRSHRDDAGAGGADRADVLWILSASLGAMVLIGVDLSDSWPILARQGRLWWMLLALIVVTWLVATRVAPFGCVVVRDRLRLVVPHVLLDVALAVVGWVVAWKVLASIALASWQFAFVDWSVHFLLLIGVSVLQVTWSTLLVQQSIRAEPKALGATLAASWRWLPRATLCCLLGWGTVLLPFVLLISLFEFDTWMLVVLALLAIEVNVVTAPLLLVALDGERSWQEAIGRALRVGLRRWRDYWTVLAVRMVLLGLVTYLSVDYSAPGEVTSRSKFGVQAFWTGAYQSECHWLDEYAAALSVEIPALVSRLSTWVFAVFALVCHLEIAHRLGSDLPGVEVTDPSSDSDPEQWAPARPDRRVDGLDAQARRRLRMRRRRRGSE